jgi:hypothetical protein
MIKLRHIASAAALIAPAAVRAETPEQWITLGTRVHGGFGSFIPLGIRIGLDAVERLNANLDPRGRYDAVMATDGLFQVEPIP